MTDKISNLELLIKVYLTNAYAILPEERLNAPGMRTCIKYYQLGIIDFVAQVENLSDDDFYLLIENIFRGFSDIKDISRKDTENFITQAKKNIDENSTLRLAMEKGASSFKEYWFKKDALAPFDLIGFVIFLEKMQFNKK